MAEDFYIKDPTSANPQVVVHLGCNAPCILKTGVSPLFLVIGIGATYMHWRCTKCHRTFSDKTIGSELQWQRYTSQPTYTPNARRPGKDVSLMTDAGRAAYIAAGSQHGANRVVPAGVPVPIPCFSWA
jgi:hypothetical protein